jgi:hypothetical protein
VRSVCGKNDLKTARISAFEDAVVFNSAGKVVTHCENRSKNAQIASKNELVTLEMLRFSHLPGGLTRFDFHT